VPQGDERLARGDERDAEALRELGLAGEALAVVQHARHDRIGEPLLDELGPAGALERGEDHGAGGVGARGGVRHPSSSIERRGGSPGLGAAPAASVIRP
jgi:hypothetical protein